MRQLRTCDFCGDDAAGVYEPYPPSVPDGPRLLLCDGCRDRLSAVVEPLVAAIEDGPTEATDGSGASASRPAPSGPAADADEPGAGTEPASPAPAAAGSGSPSEAEAGEDDADGDDAPPAGALPEEVAAAGDAASDDAAVGESRDAGGRSKAERSGAPPGYRKVMRFLENRQLPVDRAEAEVLAADAYELDESTVADAIDHAVGYGRLREVDGQLKR